jgi:ATP-dependent DNA helicase RecG
VAELKDKTGVIELTWFQGQSWVQKLLHTGHSYLVYGRVSFFNNQPQIVHPEIEILLPEQPVAKKYLEPVYPTTEKLKAKGLGADNFPNLLRHCFRKFMSIIFLKYCLMIY